MGLGSFRTFGPIKKHREHSEHSLAASSKLPDHVIGVFSRVLDRNRETHVGPISHEDKSDRSTIEIRFRGNEFVLDSYVMGISLFVTVTKKGSEKFAPAFFRYSCPVSRLGRLRKTALILQKKMSLVEVYEVHDC